MIAQPSVGVLRPCIEATSLLGVVTVIVILLLVLVLVLQPDPAVTVSCGSVLLAFTDAHRRLKH